MSGRILNFLGTALVVGAVSGSAQQVVVTVVATTDVHGRMMHWDYINDVEAPLGLSRVATVVDSIREAARGPVVVLDAGDLIQGNPFAAYYAANERTPHPIIDALNAVGYDAITPGNHEFNFGLDVLDAAYAQAEFAIVSANIAAADGSPVYDEYTVLERDGVRIGVTGFTTPGVMVWDGARVRGERRVRPVIRDARRSLADLVRDESDVRIAIIHSGMDGPSSYDETGVGTENVAAQLATLPTKPHLVVVGHSHRQMTDSVINGVHFIQARQWARSVAVAKVYLVGSSGAFQVDSVVGLDIPVGDVEPHRAFVRRLESPHADVRNWLNQPIGASRGEWSGQLARSGDTPLIDFVNAVQQRRAGTQLSSTAAFNTGAAIPDGVVRRRDVMGIYPYENRLKAVRITGDVLRQYLEKSAEYFNQHPSRGDPLNRRIPGYNYDMVSGVAYSVDISQPVGSRIRGLSYQGRPVADDDVFTLALNDYRQSGGGGFAMLSDLPLVHDGSDNIRDLLIGEVERVRELDSAAYFERSWNLIPSDAAQTVAEAFGAAPLASADRFLTRVLSVADFLGAMEPIVTDWSGDRAVGGSDGLLSAFDSLEADCRCSALRVAAGDVLKGTLMSDGTFGLGIVAMLNTAGIDVAVPGGEDYGWGVDTLAARIAQSDFPWLGANLSLRDGAGRPPGIEPWTVIEMGDARIGVVGLAGDSLTEDARRSGVAERIGFTDPIVAVTGALLQMAEANVDATVLLAHLDAYCDPNGCSGPLIDFMNALPVGRIDLVVGGHSDSEAAAIINGTPLVLPGSRGLSVGHTDLRVSVDGQHRAESGVSTVWAEEQGQVEGTEIDQVVAEVRFDALHVPGRQTGYGNLVADAYRNSARTQFGLVWNDDIGAGLLAGTWTARRLHGIQPGKRAVVEVTMRGDDLEDFLEHMVRGDNPRAHISGMHVEVDWDRREGDRVRSVRFPNGENVRGNREYTIAMSEWLATGSAGFPLPERAAVTPVGISDFEALVRYLGRIRGMVEVPPNPRIISN